MSTITKTIGTSSRDYSTMTAWEADLDNTLVYVSGDDAVGECYNDSTFDEQFDIDGGVTVGLTSTNLTVASGERHDGTAGTGALLFKTSGGSPYYNIRINLNGVNRTLEWLEYQRTGTTFGAIATISTTAGTEAYIRNNICHNIDSATTGEPAVISLANANTLLLSVTNNIVYACNHTANNATQMNGIRSIGVGPGSFIANNTVHAIGKTQGTGDCHGIGNTSDDSDLSFKNNLSTDTTNSGTGAAKDYETTSLTNTDSATNMSSDATSPETGLRNVVTSDQFVSIVSGSEDLHLKSGSDAIGAGTDLGTTPDGVQYDIDGFDRDAANRVWDIGADQAAATITKTIGTTARDYSTMTLWEADLDDSTVYQSGDDAVGECYNDSTFTENVTINGGATVGLDSVSLGVANGENHDGTAGTGVRIVGNYALTVGIALSDIVFTVSDIENSLTVHNTSPLQGLSRSDVNWLRCIVHHSHAAYAGQINSIRINRRGAVMNCIVYGTLVDRDVSLSIGILASSESDLGYYGYVYNNTVYNVTNTDTSITIGGARGISLNNVNLATHTIAKNNICVDTDTPNDPGFSSDIYFTDTANPAPYNLTSDDTGDDSTSDNTGALINKVSSDQFVSIVGGSEDLHLKAGADAIGAGTDLGTTPDGVQYDIDGVDRDARGTTWDIGADQAAGTVTKTIGTTARDYSTMTLWEADLDDSTVYQSGDDAVGECYNDSTFNEAFTINGGGTVGLSSITLTVADGEKHDGTAGTGAKLDVSSWVGLQIYRTGMDCIIEWLEITSNISTSAQTMIYVEQDSSTIISGLKNMIIHDAQTSSNAGRIIRDDGSLGHMFNIIAYNLYSSGNTLTVFYDPSNRPNYYYNVTVHNCGTISPGGSGNSLGITARSGTIIKNTLCTDMLTAGAGSATSWGTSGTEYVTNATTDTAGDITGVVAADTYVSTVGGAEDLHLKAGSDAIGAGTDLGTTPDGVQYDIDGVDRDARGTTWDIGADQAAATVTKTIGTTARDYSTMTLWEADLDDTTVYQSGDDAVGECYNDSDFNETVIINGGTTVGLSSRTLTAADGEKHDGTAGSGVRILRTAGAVSLLVLSDITGDTKVEWLEIDLNGNYCEAICSMGGNNAARTSVVANMILHGDSIGTGIRENNIRVEGSYCTFINNLVYDLGNTGQGYTGALRIIETPYSNSNVTIANNTVFNCSADTTSPDRGGITVRDSTIIKNNICVDTANADDFIVVSGTGTATDYNLSSDTSAVGVNSLVSKTSTNQFVSIVSGSEDLHLKAGSDAIGAGVDLGTTPDGVNIDIDGFDRNSIDVNWDIGAHQFTTTLSNISNALVAFFLDF